MVTSLSSFYEKSVLGRPMISGAAIKEKKTWWQPTRFSKSWFHSEESSFKICEIQTDPEGENHFCHSSPRRDRVLNLKANFNQVNEPVQRKLGGDDRGVRVWKV